MDVETVELASRLLEKMPKAERERVMQEAVSQVTSGMSRNGDDDATVQHYREFRKQAQLGKGMSPLPFHSGSKPQVKSSAGAKAFGRDFTGLVPLVLQDLIVGTTHRGAYLAGRVMEDAFHTGSTAIIMEDFAGKVVLVAVYNTDGSRAAQDFPKGRLIAVYEPFFKQRVDGTMGVRVDDPKEVVDYPTSAHFVSDGAALGDARRHVLSKSGKKGSEIPFLATHNHIIGDGTAHSDAWRALGNAAYRSMGKQRLALRKALFCYNRALFVEHPKQALSGGREVDLLDVSPGAYGFLFRWPGEYQGEKSVLRLPDSFGAVVAGSGGEAAACSGVAPHTDPSLSLQQPANRNTACLLSVLYSNMAQCCIALGDHPGAVRNAAASLALNPFNAKAEQRLAAALIAAPGGVTRALGMRIAEGGMQKWRNLTACQQGGSDAEANTHKWQGFASLAKGSSASAAKKGAPPGTLLWSEAGSGSVSTAADGWAGAAVMDPQGDPVWWGVLLDPAEHASLQQTTWAAEKELARAAFTAGRHADAKRHYARAAAIASCGGAALRRTATVLNNRAACFLEASKAPDTADPVMSQCPPASHFEGDALPPSAHTQLFGDGHSAGGCAGSTDMAALLLQRAMSDACAAALLDPFNSKPWVRQASVYRALGRHLAAPALLVAIRDRVRPVSEGGKDTAPHLQPRAAELVTAAGAAAAEVHTTQQHQPTPVSSVSTEEQLRQREAQMPEKERDNTAEEVQSLSAMFRMMPPDDLQAMLGPVLGALARRKPAQFHIEYPRTHGWPLGVDPVVCGDRLCLTFHQAEMHPWLLMMTLQQDPDLLCTPRELFKRYGSNVGMAWALKRTSQLKPGDLIDWQSESPAIAEKKRFESKLRANFGNHPCRTESLIPGKTHVAVGFNDLGVLASACLPSRMATAKSYSTNPDAPIHFKGVDRSTFSVAKTLVVWEMLRDASVPVAHVVQVWYSAAWTSAVLKSFRKCVACALQTYKTAAGLSPSEQSTFPTDARVVSYLDTWISCPVPTLRDARKGWIASDNEKLHCVASLKRTMDINAVCTYALTGDVFLHMGDRRAQTETPEIGSLCFWAAPPGAPPLEDDWVLNLVDPTQLLKDQLADVSRTPRNASQDMDLLGLAVRRLTCGIQALRDLSVAGRLEVQLFCAEVELEHTAVVQQIADWHAWTMSWSNIMDYVSPLDRFHALARACSAKGDTLHFGYSMNWPADVHGTSLLDYIHCASPEWLNKLLLEDALATSALVTGTPVGEALFVSPPFTSPLNVTAFFLGVSFHNEWTAHFKQKAECLDGYARAYLVPGKNTGMRVMYVECMAVYTQLSRMASPPLEFAWTYDTTQNWKMEARYD